MHLLIESDDADEVFTMIQDFGVTSDVKGEKFINKYPVDYNSFYKIKLKIKLDGDDYVFGETMIGLEGYIQPTLDKSINKTSTLDVMRFLHFIY